MMKNEDEIGTKKNGSTLISKAYISITEGFEFEDDKVYRHNETKLMYR